MVETVERHGRTYASINGVESTAFVEKVRGVWYLYDFVIAAVVPSASDGIARIVDAMGRWYTSDQAAIRLAELGAYDKAPSRQTISKLAQAGAFPGAFKLLGKGKRAVGSGGQWRIPEDGVMEYARRMGK